MIGQLKLLIISISSPSSTLSIIELKIAMAVWAKQWIQVITSSTVLLFVPALLGFLGLRRKVSCATA